MDADTRAPLDTLRQSIADGFARDPAVRRIILPNLPWFTRVYLALSRWTRRFRNG